MRAPGARSFVYVGCAVVQGLGACGLACGSCTQVGGAWMVHVGRAHRSGASVGALVGRVGRSASVGRVGLSALVGRVSRGA